MSALFKFYLCKYYLFIPIIFSQISLLFSQNLKIESCFRVGTLISHREDMTHISISRSTSIELNWYFLNSSNSSIKSLTGLSLVYGNLGNNHILGESFGISSFYKLPLFSSVKNELSFRVGAGFGYVSKVFNLDYNQKNTAVSSHLNALIDFSLNHSVSISERFNFYYGIAFKHLSNGATSVPNLGLNYPELKVGFGMNSMSDKLTFEKTIDKRRNNLFAIMGGGFFKQIIENYGIYYPVYYGSLFYQRGLKQSLSIELGLDGMYNSSLIYLFYNNKNKLVSNSEPFQLGVYIGGNAHVNKLHFLIGMGVYTLDRYGLNGPVYHKLSLRYKPLNNLLLGVGIKSHWLNADYLDVSVGFAF